MVAVYPSPRQTTDRRYGHEVHVALVHSPSPSSSHPLEHLLWVDLPSSSFFFQAHKQVNLVIQDIVLTSSAVVRYVRPPSTFPSSFVRVLRHADRIISWLEVARVMYPSILLYLLRPRQNTFLLNLFSFIPFNTTIFLNYSFKDNGDPLFPV